MILSPPAFSRKAKIIGASSLLGVSVAFALFVIMQVEPNREARSLGHEQESSGASSVQPDHPSHAAHLANLGADSWHRQGRLGQGVKIAVLDSGFRGYQQFLGKGLPAEVKVRSFRRDKNLEARDSQHGILCAEIIHALAPKAELLFANWEPDSPDAFLDAVSWAKSEGASVISCSLIMPSWSDGEGGGDVHKRLHRLLGDGTAAGDILCFASAGNTAQRHWSGPLDAKNGWHCWHGDVVDNPLTPWGGERVSVECYGPAASEYEIMVLRETGELVGKATRKPDSDAAVLRFDPEDDVKYLLRVQSAAAAKKGSTLRITVLGAELKHTTAAGSIAFPGDGATVCAVGAVDARRRREAYSSCGPNSRLPKPDFVATVPFPSKCRSHPFTGTSAAAPQAAGLAALLWTATDRRTPRTVIAAMRAAAIDLGPPGHDYDTGYGLIRLPQAVMSGK